MYASTGKNILQILKLKKNAKKNKKTDFCDKKIGFCWGNYFLKIFKQNTKMCGLTTIFRQKLVIFRN